MIRKLFGFFTRREGCFSGGKFAEVSVGRADRGNDFFQDSNHHNTSGRRQTHGEFKFFARERSFFSGQKCDKKSIGQTVLHVKLQYFLPHKLPKTLLVNAILLLVHVTCFVGHFSLFCWVKNRFSYHTVNAIRSTRPGSTLPAYPTAQAAALLYCKFSTNSRGESEPQWNFTPFHI